MEGRKKCAAYARMARCDNPADMDTQVNLLLEVAKNKGYEVSKVYREVASGIGSIEERPVLSDLLGDVKQGLYDAIVVRDVSRFSRSNHSVMGLTLATLKTTETAIVTADCEYFPSSEKDMRMLELLSFTTMNEANALHKKLEKTYLRPSRPRKTNLEE